MDRPDPAEEELSGRRLFAAALPVRGAEVELGSEAAQHAHVLRLAVGALLELFDGAGGTVPVRIVGLGKRSLRCEAIGDLVRVERGPRLVLVQCMPRAGKLDDIVRMTTELGVSAIHLALSEWTIVRRGADHKLERLERVAVEAARQSEQAYLPTISAPRPLADVLSQAPQGAFRGAFVERSATDLPTELPADEAWLVVGPEGGLSERDRTEIAAAGFQGLSLGRSILRTETAAVVGVGLLAERLRRRR